MTALAMHVIAMLLFSLVMINVNSTVSLVAYANKDKGIVDAHSPSLAKSISSQLVKITMTDPDPLQQVLEIIQNQISITSGQDKANKAIDQIKSIVQLNPNGPLSQSLLNLAKQQAAGNTNGVTQAATEVAINLANSSNDNIGQIIEQAASHTEQGVLPLQSPVPPSPPRLLLPSPSTSLLSSASSSSSSSFSLTRQPSSVPISGSSCGNLPISTITATGSDGRHVPQNAIDNNLATPWTNHAVGSWIEPDMGKKTSICGIDIAWYRGNMRQNDFVISVSNDTKSFTKVFSGKSTGTTLSYETYSFSPITARYVRITVNGNTENAWTSISEIKVNGFRPNTPPVATAGPAQIVKAGSTVVLNGSPSGDPDGYPIKFAWSQVSGPPVKLNNATTLKPSFVTPSSLTTDTPMTFKLTVTDKAGLSSTDMAKITVKPAIVVDEFGIRKIYQTKSGGEEWFMNMTNPTSDNRLFTRIDSSSFTKNADGSWKITKPPLESRFDIFTSSGYNQDLITTYDQSKLASKGYMQSPNDWKNVEMTGYVKLNSYSDVSHAFEWYNRGGFHSTTFKCEGTAYKGSISYAGQTQFQKEQWHPSYSSTDWKQATSSDPKGRWMGFKYIVYNFQLNGQPAVKMENWIDDKGDGNWVKVDEHVDSGGWGTAGTDCGGSPDQLITWGGPTAAFRFDGITDLDFKNFSVREIQPPQ